MSKTQTDASIDVEVRQVGWNDEVEWFSQKSWEYVEGKGYRTYDSIKGDVVNLTEKAALKAAEAERVKLLEFYAQVRVVRRTTVITSTTEVL